MSKPMMMIMPGRKTMDGFTSHTFTHPKGKPYSFFVRDNNVYEINHLKEKYHSAFVTKNDKTSIKCPESFVLTRYDTMFLLIPLLESHADKGKMEIEDLEIPSVLIECIRRYRLE